MSRCVSVLYELGVSLSVVAVECFTLLHVPAFVEKIGAVNPVILFKAAILLSPNAKNTLRECLGHPVTPRFEDASMLKSDLSSRPHAPGPIVMT